MVALAENKILKSGGRCNADAESAKICESDYFVVF